MSPDTASNIPTPTESEAIGLWPNAGPSAEQWTLRSGLRVVRNVSAPTLLPVMPAPGQANGQAVLVLPGGGFRFLAIDHEGHDVAQRLADAGYAAFVLKYRLLPTAPDAATFVADYDAFIVAAMSRPPEQRGGGSSVYAPAVEDARSAMRLLRRRCAEWQVQATRIGLIGFSAGALIGRALVETPEAGTVPDSLALLYGSMLKLPAPPPSPLPPLFAALAADDPLFGRQGFGLVESWQQAGQRAELHCYERGGHGFGMQPLGSTSDHWMDAYLAWLAKQ